MFVLLWLRRPEELLNAQFWAEDGNVFFRDQTLFGFWNAFTLAYAGYFHTIPRLVAATFSVLPVRFAPFAFNFTTLFIEAICCGMFALPQYRKLIESDSLRAVACVAAAVCPVCGWELVGTVCNLQWYLCILSLLLIAYQVKTLKADIALSVVQVLIAVSAPVTLLYLPFLVWQAVKRPGAFKVRPVVHSAAIVLQALIVHHGVRGPKPKLHFNSFFLGIADSGISRCVLSPLVGSHVLVYGSDAALIAKLTMALCAVTIVFTLAVVKLRHSKGLMWLGVAFYVGAGSLFAMLWGRNELQNFLVMDGLRHYTAERYFLLGTCMFIFAAALAIETFVPYKKKAIALAALFLYGGIQNYAAKPLTDLHWAESAAKIEQWKAARHRHEPSAPLSVPINPAPNWFLLLN